MKSLMRATPSGSTRTTTSTSTSPREIGVFSDGGERRHSTERRADQYGWSLKRRDIADEVLDEPFEGVVVLWVPVAVAVAARVQRDRGSAVGGKSLCRPRPRVPCLTAAVQQQHDIVGVGAGPPLPGEPDAGTVEVKNLWSHVFSSRRVAALSPRRWSASPVRRRRAARRSSVRASRPVGGDRSAGSRAPDR